MAKRKTLETLLAERKILLGALWEQKTLVELLPMYGHDPAPFEANAERMRQRLQKLQKEIQDHGAD